MMHSCDWYPYFPVRILRGSGLYLFADDGKRYMDTFSGIGVQVLGHSYVPVLRQMLRKMRRYTHLSNFFKDDDLDTCIYYLMEASGLGGGVFFTNSGTEATECALKVIKKHADDEKNQILYFDHAFHGRTLGALSVNGFEGLSRPFKPLLPYTSMLPRNDPQSFNNFMKANGHHVKAIFCEFIQGAGGVHPMDDAMAHCLKEWHSKLDFWWVADEIQSGLGRTGKMFSYQHYDVEPDMVLVGKGLGGGLPLSGVILHEKLKDMLKPGDHGSTFAPNPVALAGCRKILKKIPKFLPAVQAIAPAIREIIVEEMGDYVQEIRGEGFMMAIELKQTMPDLRLYAMEKHQLLLNVLQDKVVRLLPPLNTSLAQWKKMIHRLARSVKEVKK